MIISHRYRFIFLKTEKTASTSIWAVLRQVAEEKDTLHPADILVRRKVRQSFGDLGSVSFIGSRRGLRRALPQLTGLHEHSFARHVRAFIGPELFERYTIITSERNPFDRQLSLYGHRQQRRRSDPLAGFSRSMQSPLYNLLHYNRVRNLETYTIDDRVCAQFVIRYENLNDDFRTVLTHLGIQPDRFPLPRLKQTRQDSVHYRDHYTEEARHLVETWYRREIEHFGYAF